jgi:lysozyme
MKEPWWRNLDDNRQRILANMCFNLGYPRLSGFKNFLSALQVSDFEKAAVEMMDSKWADQVGDRAKRLRDRMLHDS